MLTLILRTIKDNTVETARNDVIATALGRNLKVSGEKDLIKDIVKSLRGHLVSTPRGIDDEY